MSSSFPQNMAQGRTYYAPYQPHAIQVAYRPVSPMRLPQGLSARPDSIGFNNRPPMGQSLQPSQQTSGQAGGNSVWPLVAGGAALAGVVYYGYNWLTKPKAEETAETMAETIEHSEEPLTEGATRSEAAVLAKEAATETPVVSSSVSVEGSTLAKAAEGAVETVEKEVSGIVQKGVEKAPSMMSRISNALSHKAVMIPAALATAAAAEYAYPVVTPLVRTYAPVAAEYAAKSPALAADMWQAARQSIGNAIMNLRYSGASTCAVPAKETLQTLSQAVCKPGEEPLTYLAGQQASRLWNYGAASLSALGTGISGWFGSTAAKEGAEKLGQGSVNVLESSAKNLGQCGLDEAPSYVSQKLSEGGQYLSGLFGSALQGAKSLVGGAGSEVAPEIVSSGKSAVSSLTCPVPKNPLLCMGSSSTVAQAAKLTCPVPKNPLADMVTSATNFTSQAPIKTLGNLTTSASDLSSSFPSLAGQATKTAKSISSTTTPAADNTTSSLSGWFDWFKPTQKLPLEPESLSPNVSSLTNVTNLEPASASQSASLLSNVTDLVTGTPKLPIEPTSASQSASLLSNVTDLVTGTPKPPIEPASASQSASLLSNVTDLVKAAKKTSSSISPAPSSSVNLTNPLPTSPANLTVV